ncbi:MAG: type I 3-dehydroquinate dehydratase [Phycisphaerales bacterium]|nr:type I 3-dehydroquinate dehydratase [Phycisphaerales bacterium]
MTLLCTPILTDTADAALRAAALAKMKGADLVEYRVDRLFDGSPDSIDACLRLAKDSPLPCIVTCRTSREGGEYDGPDDERVALYEALGTAEHPPRYLDLEQSTLDRSSNLRQKIRLAVHHPAQLRESRPSLILSMHDFDRRPADLIRRLSAMHADDSAAVLKVAYRARSLRDNLELFDLLALRSRPMIALGMGEFGLMSRILAPKFGGFLTFASLHPSEVTAPGQPTLDELVDLYRFRAIGPATRVYGVVGWPVAHSLSPLVHNAGFHAPGVEADAVYIPLPIPPEWEHFKATLLVLCDHPRLDFSGASVTLPHKEHLARLAREEGWTIDPLAERIGAANTLVRASSGWKVANTDATAAAESLQRAMGWLKNRRIAVIGAGGVARAVATALVDQGATVALYNRTKGRAEALVAEVRAGMSGGGGQIVAAPYEKLCGACCEAFVNCTPLGMTGGPAPGESPIPPAEFENIPHGSVIFDTVYNPLRTPLLNAALDHNLTIVDGAEMFVRQAEQQFRLFTGHAPPSGLFDRLAREKLRDAR